MKNFPFDHEGKTLWFSRSLACGVLLYGFCGGHLYVLANQRGKNNYYKPLCWNAPGGFIDFDESASECAARELFEETGIKLDPNDLNFLCIDSYPQSERQTIIARFCYLADKNLKSYNLTDENSEPDEIAAIQWIRCDKETLSKFNWTKDQFKYILQGKSFIRKKFPLKYLWLKIKTWIVALF